MLTDTLKKHRRAGLLAVGIAALGGCVGAGGATVAAYANHESISRYQVDATLDGNRLSVDETIDYDFGADMKHGLVREVDLGVVDRPQEHVNIQNVTAQSATADDNVQLTQSFDTANIRVGDPNKTYQGTHRYQLGYDLVGVPRATDGGRFVFIAIGDRWRVPIHDVTVHVATDFDPGNVTCSLGAADAFAPCHVSVKDGVVTADVPSVKRGQGVVLNIGAGPSRTPAVLTPPSLDIGETSEPWVGAALGVGSAAAAAGIVGALIAGRWVRRAGADRTGAVGNPAAAAYATAGPTEPDGTGSEGVPVSDAEAAREVTIQFAPPEGLTPPLGAVVLREHIDQAAKTAWLAQSVIDGWATLEGDPGKPTITKAARAEQDPGNMPAPLAAAFNGRSSIQLGHYDSSFAAGWGAIGGQLSAWKTSSGLWDNQRGQHNKIVAFALLAAAVVVAGIVGIALVAGLGRHVGVAAPIAAVAGVLFGFGVRSALGISTLDVRSPAGFGLWLRTEGFRQFLHESEGEHARWAAEHNLLREYSAWAVALGELDRWNRATAAAGIPPTDPGLATAVAFVGLSSMVHSTSVAPSSSGGGGGFSGGGFSGGVGGGGGGSW